MTFREGSTVLGTATLSGGTASLEIPAGDTAGERTFTATYEGSIDASGSTSNAAVLVVTAVPTPTLTITPTRPPR